MFSDEEARRIGRFDSGASNYIVGSRIDSSKDGCEKTASFVQPTGVCAEGETIFLTDTGAAAVKIVSPAEGLADFLKQNSMLYTSRGIQSNQPPDLLTVISLWKKQFLTLKKPSLKQESESVAERLWKALTVFHPPRLFREQE